MGEGWIVNRNSFGRGRFLGSAHIPEGFELSAAFGVNVGSGSYIAPTALDGFRLGLVGGRVWIWRYPLPDHPKRA